MLSYGCADVFLLTMAGMKVSNRRSRDDVCLPLFKRKCAGPIVMLQDLEEDCRTVLVPQS
jgi:hypothetical protein